MDALDDIRRLIAETQQEVKATAVKRRCWGLHSWSAWVDKPTYQERRCVDCNKRQWTKPVACEDHTFEVLEFDRAHAFGAWVGYGSLQRCTRCGFTIAVVDRFDDD